jgi:maltooligosyltrehalose trehalohydrolase
MAIGAEPAGRELVSFRIWAPDHATVELVVDGRQHDLRRDQDGYHAAVVADVRAGSRYGFRVPGLDLVLPDPASRSQPDGPHGLSEVIDASAFAWSDAGWRGVALEGSVVMELHVGTFTPEGTYRAAADRLAHLADLGVTVVELMPLADYSGRFGWGYDGVGLFAPTALHGTPDDLRYLVDCAHQLGIGVILDVVYNHVGPDGAYLRAFALHYFSTTYENEWGEPINFDGPGAGPVRDFFTENAAYWVREFHMDGLRLDATQQIFDASPRHIVADVTAAARAAAPGRRVLVVAENEPQDTRLLAPPEAGGCGIDALWNDDLHHAARVVLTGFREAYYSDYTGDANELAAALRHGFLMQGQRSAWQKKPRGTPALDMEPKHFIAFLENHDQVANSTTGDRLSVLADPALLRAMTLMLLVGPETPMLFQGQEFGSRRPFHYFADHGPELARAVREGRMAFMGQFPSAKGEPVPDPAAPATYRRSVLDWSDCTPDNPVLLLHRDALRLRREDPTLRLQGSAGLHSGAVGDVVFLRYRGTDPSLDRLLIINLGGDHVSATLATPLVAPPGPEGWRRLIGSEELRYGGRGMAPFETRDGYRFEGRAATLLAAAATDLDAARDPEDDA